MSKRFVRRLLGFLGVVVPLVALPSPAAALERKLTAADGAANGIFGFSVAIDGDTAVVGAPAGTGAVYVFARAGDSWTQTAKLTASNGKPGSLGLSVAIDGDRIVAGAPDEDFSGNAVDQNKGSVYAFTRTGATTRTEIARFRASDATADDNLGISVAIDGDTIVAGAFGADVGAGPNEQQGAAYTFDSTKTGAQNETGKMTAADGATGDRLGGSVGIDGDTIVAGADHANSDQGAAYTFKRTGGFSTAKLTASDGVAKDNLGFAVSIQGDTIVAGAPSDDVGTNKDQGSAYTFARTGAAARTETAKLTASDGAPDDNLGESAPLDANRIVVGATFADVGGNIDQGAAYTFGRTGAAARTETSKLTSADGAEGDWLGESTALSGDTIFAGAHFDDVGANKDQGSVSVFSPDPPATPLAEGTGSTGLVAIPPIARASVSGFDFSPDVIAVAKRPTPISAVAKGGRFKFTLSLAARVSIAIDRKVPGRRLGRRCVRPRRGLRRRCTRYLRKGTLLRSGKPGRNTVAFSGRIGRRALPPGRYRATIRATNAAGRSAARTTSFRVVRATR